MSTCCNQLESSPTFPTTMSFCPHSVQCILMHFDAPREKVMERVPIAVVRMEPWNVKRTAVLRWSRRQQELHHRQGMETTEITTHGLGFDFQDILACQSNFKVLQCLRLWLRWILTLGISAKRFYDSIVCTVAQDWHGLTMIEYFWNIFTKAGLSQLEFPLL